MGAYKLLLEGVTKVYRDGKRSIEVLKPIDLTVAQGEFVSLVGPSGCGKSTLFNIIAGVDDPTSGHIVLNSDVDAV